MGKKPNASKKDDSPKSVDFGNRSWINPLIEKGQQETIEMEVDQMEEGTAPTTSNHLSDESDWT